jgi:hypothetical protein
MKILNDHNGEISGLVQLTEADCCDLIAALVSDELAMGRARFELLHDQLAGVLVALARSRETSENNPRE